MCCAAHYGGQTGGACSNVIATTNQNTGKYVAHHDVDSHLRQGKRQSAAIIKQQHFIGIPILKAFQNLQLPSWLTKHAVKLGNNDAVLVEKEQDIIKGEYPWDKQSSSFTFVDQGPRTLLSPWCRSTTPEMWHPDYSNAWSNGGCTLKADCDSPGFSTQLECCKAAYGGQTSGACIKRLPIPPTFSPTTVSTKWYADQGGAWSTGGCKNTTPLPIYATIFFDTQLLCCKGAFGGQMSGACIKGLPNPPTLSPTTVESAAGKSGMLIKEARGQLVAARIPPHIQSMPPWCLYQRTPQPSH